jgi:hypothetical protein
MEVVTPYKGQVRVLRKMMHLQNGLNVEQVGPDCLFPNADLGEESDGEKPWKSSQIHGSIIIFQINRHEMTMSRGYTPFSDTEI